MKRLLLVLWPILVGLTACSSPDRSSTDAEAISPSASVMTESDAPADVIAVFEGGQITEESFDEAILALPPDQRQGLTVGQPDAFRDIVRELAMDAVLIQEAELVGADQAAEFQTQVRAIRRNIVVERFLEENLPAIEPPTDADLADEYRRRADDFQRPARRLVFNIFRRLQPGGSLDALKEEMNGIREQVLAGQGFNVLASRLSDSESRHREGELGWFQPGQLSPELDDVIFALEEGVPSLPIATRDGVHLFYVDVAVEAKDFSLEDARPRLTRQLMAQRRDDALAQLEETLDVDVDIFKPDSDELRAILQRGDPQEVVLRIGTFELPLRHFAIMLDNDRAQRPKVEGSRAEQVLRTVWRGELVFQQQLAAGVSLDAADEERVLSQSHQVLAFQGRQQKLRLRLDEEPRAIQTFFEDNRMRFTSPLKLRIRRLSVPIGERPSEVMALLERRRRDLDAGSETLDTLAAELGGETEGLDWKSLPELHAFEPRLAEFATKTASERHSPPFRVGESLQLFRVEEREEPSPLPFEAVRDQVRSAYVERNGQRLYRELRDEILEEAGFELFEERFEALLASGVASSKSST